MRLSIWQYTVAATRSPNTINKHIASMFASLLLHSSLTNILIDLLVPGAGSKELITILRDTISGLYLFCINYWTFFLFLQFWVEFCSSNFW